MSRRQVLKGVAGGVVAAPFMANGLGFANAQTSAKPIRIAWNTGAVCSAPVGYAVEKGILSKHGIAGETVNFAGSTEQLLEAIATGKADAGVGMALRWLKPLEQGFDVKVVAGTHGGCIRLLGSKAAGVTELAHLKGKTIAVSDLASPGKSFFSILLSRAGIDPNKDVDWRVFPGDLLALAIEKGEAQALAHWDPESWRFLKDGNLVEIANNLEGEFANRTCCVIAVRGSLLREDKAAVKALVTGLLEASTLAANDPAGAAQVYFDTYKPRSSLDDLTAMLKSHTHHHHPIGDALKNELSLYAGELKEVRVLKPATDPQKFAERIFGDVFG
jgi:NitT/TauT family transport system substrate-binding protein